MELVEKTEKVNVSKWNYGEYSSDNYGANSIALEVGSRTLYFSYDTVVAFRGHNSEGKYFDCVCENCWGPTTGKHLNWINPNKDARLDYDNFQKELQKFLQ